MTEYNVKGFESVVDYDTHIQSFDGPLDLLLYLVNKEEIDIKDIFISDVTDQFLKYMDQVDDLDMEKAGEYLNIAATLLEIKSKRLLPKVDEYLDDNQENPEQVMIRKLEEYKLYKEASLKLKEQENVNRYYKDPAPSADDVRVVYKDFNLNGLIKAFTDLLNRVDIEERNRTEQKEIPKEVFTVADKMEFIKTTMLEKHECSFFELFTGYTTRNECITTFQAMLELLKRQFIRVEQNAVFDDITIILRDDRSEVEIADGELAEYN